MDSSDERDASSRETPTVVERGSGKRGSAPESSPPAAPDARVRSDRYEIGAEIARGGMGRVVEATDRILGRVVALKEALASDPDALRRFAREIRITARLEHPSIVPIHDLGVSDDGAPFYVMRKVSGRALDVLIKGAGTLDARLALLPHVLAASQAVAHAHRRGVIHRDIKPPNILVGELGETIVIDWGLAKVTGDADDDAPTTASDAGHSLQTRYGTVVGTPGFMSPEQAKGDAVDAQADVYALGATLYYLLSRRPPHDSHSGTAMMEAAIAGPSASIASVVPGVPRELATIIDKALSYDLAIRYRDAAGLADDLQQFLTGRLVASHHYTASERILRFMRRHMALVVVAGLAIAGVGIAAWLAVSAIVTARDAALAEARAQESARTADRAAAMRQTERADDLVFGQARALIPSNPAAAIALVRPYATGARWREVRAIAAGARAVGVPWRLADAPRSVAFSPDGQSLAAIDATGVIRIHGLHARTSRELTRRTDKETWQLRYLDADRILLHDDARLEIVDVATGAVRLTTTLPNVMTMIATVGTTVYALDRDHALWKLGAAGRFEPVAVADSVNTIAAARDGHALAIGGQRQLSVLDASGKLERLSPGPVTALHWAHDENRLVATIDARSKVDIFIAPTRWTLPLESDEWTGAGAVVDGSRYTFATSGKVYSTGGIVAADIYSAVEEGELPVASGRVVVVPTNQPRFFLLDRIRIIAVPTLGTGCLIDASARSPYVVGRCDDDLFVWDTRQLLPDHVSVQAGELWASAPTRIAWQSGSRGVADLDLTTHEVTAWQARLPPDWNDATVRDVAPSGGRVLMTVGDPPRWAVLDRDRPGSTPLPVGTVDADLDGDHHLVLATADGTIDRLEMATGTMTRLETGRGKVEWIGVNAGWLLVSLSGGTILRRNLRQLEEPAAIRVVDEDAKLTEPTEDGTIWIANGTKILAWKVPDALVELVALPKPIEHVQRIDVTGALVRMKGAREGVVVSAEPPHQIHPATGVDRQGAMSIAPSAGLVAFAHGDDGDGFSAAPGVTILDAIGAVSWTMAATSMSPPRLSRDGRWLVSDAAGEVHIWTLDLPTGPVATDGWLRSLTNAAYDPAVGVVTWD